MAPDLFREPTRLHRIALVALALRVCTLSIRRKHIASLAGSTDTGLGTRAFTLVEYLSVSTARDTPCTERMLKHMFVPSERRLIREKLTLRNRHHGDTDLRRHDGISSRLYRPVAEQR